MKRVEKMILAAGAGVLCMGVVLSVAAFAMGGRPSSMVVQNGMLRVERWDAHAPSSFSSLWRCRRSWSRRVERWDAHAPSSFSPQQGADSPVSVPSGVSSQPGTDSSVSSPLEVDGRTENALSAADRFDVETGLCELVVKAGEPGSEPVLRVQNIQENWVRWRTDEGWLEIDLCTDLHGAQVPKNA